MEDITTKAAEFARKAHTKHFRKYTGEPYFNHLHEVAMILYEHGFRDETIAAAYLHDTIEDTSITREMIEKYFGPVVAQLVWEVTDASIRPEHKGKYRKERKEIDRQWLAKASPAAQSIKLADLISNGKDIVAGDKDFAKVYLREKEALLQVLTSGCSWLYTRAKFELIRGQKELVQHSLSQKP